MLSIILIKIHSTSSLESQTIVPKTIPHNQLDLDAEAESLVMD